MSIRTERVARLLQRELADILAKHTTPDPLVTLTTVRVTRDLSVARVYVSVYAPTLVERTAAFDLLKNQTRRWRAALGQRLRHQMRAIPELRFILDDTTEEAKQIEALLARTGVSTSE